MTWNDVILHTGKAVQKEIQQANENQCHVHAIQLQEMGPLNDMTKTQHYSSSPGCHRNYISISMCRGKKKKISLSIKPVTMCSACFSLVQRLISDEMSNSKLVKN